MGINLYILPNLFLVDTLAKIVIHSAMGNKQFCPIIWISQCVPVEYKNFFNWILPYYELDLTYV